jgi:nucleotide-binding universal stress UspA family protein
MTIVCGTDFSKHAAKAAQVAAAFAARLKEPLRLVHVVPKIADDLGAKNAVTDPVATRLRTEADRLRGLGAEVSEEVLSGLPDEVLCGVALQQHARLLVIASIGMRDPQRWLLGSTAARSVQSAHVPVLVVRESAPFESWLRGERSLRLMLGIDFSESADSALRWLHEMRAIGPCDVLIEHVAWAPGQQRRFGLHGDLAAQLPEIERMLMRDLRAKVGDVPGSGEVRFHIDFCEHGVEQRLVSSAKDFLADVAVVGVRRHAHPDNIWDGMTSRGVVHQAPMSVVCVPLPVRAETAKPIPAIRSVLAATDFSDLGDSALAYAYALVPSGGTVHLAHVQKGSVPDRARDMYRLQSLTLLEAGQRGVRTLAHILSGKDVAGELCAAAERLGVDAICIGSHGESGIKRLLGSVAQKILAESRRPVFLVRPPNP